MVGSCFQLPGITTRQDGSPSWSALGVRSVGVVKQDTFTSHAVEVRCFDPARAIDPHVGKGSIVCYCKENIWLFRRILLELGTAKNSRIEITRKMNS